VKSQKFAVFAALAIFAAAAETADVIFTGGDILTMRGDAVVKLWGPERSAGAMASRTFLRAGLPFTYSHDAPR
jgi:hypothetical protein